MAIAPVDHHAEQVMHQWVLPVLFFAVSVFCLAIAVGAALDRHWPGTVVLGVVAFGLAAIADDARGQRCGTSSRD